VAGQRRAGASAASHASPLHPRVRPRHDDSHIATAIVPRIPNPRSETPARKSRNAVIASADSRIHAGVRSNRPRVIRYEPPAQKLAARRDSFPPTGTAILDPLTVEIAILDVNQPLMPDYSRDRARHHEREAQPRNGAHRSRPNGWRVSGEPGRAQRATRVRCTRGLGSRTTLDPRATTHTS